jgi:hypothetical protein
VSEASLEGSWPLAVLLTAALLVALTLFAHRNLPYAGFWYDEAVQFWVSRGVDPFAAPGRPPGGTVAVIRQNGRANLDPGGFGLLLRVWMRGGLDPAWLRTLPFLVFLGGLAVIARLGWVCRPSPVFALFSASLPLAFPLLRYHVTEVRAYTMEFTGVVLACLLLCRAGARPSAGNLALTGITVAVFMSSRYSYAIFAGAVCLVLAPVIWGGPTRDLGARRRRLLAFGIPVLGGGAFVAANLWLQRGRLIGWGGAYVEYLAPATAAGKSVGHLATAVGANLLSPVAIPVTLAAVVALTPARWLARSPAGRLGIGASPEARLLYRVSLATLTLSAVLWRWHPWDVSRKWSLFLHALSAVMVVRLAADILGELTSGRRTDAAARTGRRARAVAPAVMALVVLGVSLHAATQRRAHWNDLTAVLSYLERVPLGAGSVAVGVHPYPILRYLCEHGPFVGRLPYPEAFRLPYRGGPESVIGPQTRYLIAFEGAHERARLYAGADLRADSSWPAHLYAVGLTAGPPDQGTPPAASGER